MEKIYILDKDTNITYYLIGVESISPNQQAVLTEYPVPEGSFITDHSYKNADSLSLSVISDGYNNVKKSYCVDINGNSYDLTYERFKDIIQTWQKEAHRLDIQTLHHLFRNMILTGISWNEGNKWSLFKPTLTFKEARIGQLTNVSLSALGVSYTASYTPTEVSSGKDDGQTSIGENVASFIDKLDVTQYIPGLKDWGFLKGIRNAGHKITAGATNAVVGFFSQLFGGNNG